MECRQKLLMGGLSVDGRSFFVDHRMKHKWMECRQRSWSADAFGHPYLLDAVGCASQNLTFSMGESLSACANLRVCEGASNRSRELNVGHWDSARILLHIGHSSIMQEL